MSHAIDPDALSLTEVIDPSTNPEPPLTECPPWCRFKYADHSWDGIDARGLYNRPHVVDVGWTPASLDDYTPRPDAHVCLEQVEASTDGQSVYSRIAVRLMSEGDPRFTAREARQVAAHLVAAAELLDTIVGA